MNNQLRRFFFSSLIALFFAFPGCDCTGTTGSTTVACDSPSDCPSDQECVDGFCREGSGDTGLGDGQDAGDGSDALPGPGEADADGDTGRDVGDVGDAGDTDTEPEIDPCPDGPTCDDLEVQCGTHPDGCGGFLHCGSCEYGFYCGEGEDRGRCIEEPCDPITDCSGTNLECGSISDGCGGTVSCGLCGDDFYCGAGEQFGTCLPLSQCTPTTCDEQGAKCGRISDGCGGLLDCSACPDGQACFDGICKEPADCQPKTCADLGASCGRHADGCGGLTDDCGSCPAEHACGTGEDLGRCILPKCVKKTCDDYNVDCGTMPDGCGGEIYCGGCTEPEVCGGSGTPNVCGAENTGPCNGELCEFQRFCPGGGATVLKGTVYAPNGTLPLANAVVYVPGVPLENLPAIHTGTGVCQRCEDEDLGDPIAGAVSDAEGKFEIKHVPAGVDFPLVIKVGQWRRVVTIPAVEACETTELTDPEYTRLAKSMDPVNRPHDNIPHVAISTGRVDAMECVFYKVGVDRSEFTNHLEDGRIHMYRSNGGMPDKELSDACSSSSRCGSDTCTDHDQSCGSGANATLIKKHLANHLYQDEDRLHQYDMVVFDCEGYNRLSLRSNDDRDRIREYANAGGRIFASHFSIDWIRDNGDFKDVFNSGSGSDGSAIGRVDTSHGRGEIFWNWIKFVDAYHTLTPPQIDIKDPRGLVKSIKDDSLATNFVYIPAGTGYSSSDSIQQFSFDTPVTLEKDELHCGRVAYSGFHVSGGSTGGGRLFPDYCPNKNTLTNQEKILAYMLFDLGACITPSDEPPEPVCYSKSCAELGANCGWVSDGCGENLIYCGDCNDGEMCGAGGVPNVCAEPCTKLTCNDHGADCGTLPDGCGDFLDCGDCEGNLQCGAGGTPNVCACIPLTCEDHNAQCGEPSDGCGGTLDCGTCPDGIKCGGGGIANRCDSDCTPLTCDDHGAQCGELPDGCGDTLNCGTCDSPRSCGGGGEPNICGCTPLTCDDHDASCGEVSDGCGGTLLCGGCEGDMICEDLQCVDPPCRPAGDECSRSSQCCSRICGGGICVVN